MKKQMMERLNRRERSIYMDDKKAKVQKPAIKNVVHAICILVMGFSLLSVIIV